MNNKLKHLLYKLIFASLPLVLIIMAYVLTDPFKKLRNYDIYSFDYVMLHRGDISTRVFLKNKDRHHYDSFIFGSSRSTVHTADSWKKYLPPGSSPFSFGSWNESVEGICRKIQLIDRSKSTIRHAFILIDVDYAFDSSYNDPLDYDHYLISGKSKWDYYLSDFFKYLNNPRLILTSIDYTIYNKRRFYMGDFIGLRHDHVNPVTNDWGTDADEQPVVKSAYKTGKSAFYARSTTQQYANKKIDVEKIKTLMKIHEILQKHGTRYFIVISPLYDQLKLNTNDISTLQDIFGKDNIYDYSGINNITNNIYNYNTDVIHYRRTVGKTIFREIYSSPE